MEPARNPKAAAAKHRCAGPASFTRGDTRHHERDSAMAVVEFGGARSGVGDLDRLPNLGSRDDAAVTQVFATSAAVHSAFARVPAATRVGLAGGPGSRSRRRVGPRRSRASRSY